MEDCYILGIYIYPESTTNIDRQSHPKPGINLAKQDRLYFSITPGRRDAATDWGFVFLCSEDDDWVVESAFNLLKHARMKKVQFSCVFDGATIEFLCSMSDERDDMDLRRKYGATPFILSLQKLFGR